MPQGVGGLPGGAVDPGAPGLRPQVGGGHDVSRPGAGGGVADGTVVEGLVTAKDGESYQVRIGAQLLNARATIPLFVGQRFRALWDASSSPPTLRLQPSDTAVLARFSGRDGQIAASLLSRALPVKDEVILEIRRQWLRSGGDPARLGTLIELWARGAPMTEGNAALLSWYMELAPEHAMLIWGKIRERLHKRAHKSAASLLAALKGDGDGDADEEILRFLQAHTLAARPALGGLTPAVLTAPAWWPAEDREGRPAMARVAISSSELKGRKVWRAFFEMDGDRLGPVLGDVMTNGRAFSIGIKLKDHAQVPYVREHISALRAELEKIAIPVQHLTVSESRPEAALSASKSGLDMEA